MKKAAHIRRKKRFLDFCDREIILELQDFYQKKDWYDGSICLKIFNELYVSEEKLSYEKIRRKLYITAANTVERFAEKANAFAEKLSNVK